MKKMQFNTLLATALIILCTATLASCSDAELPDSGASVKPAYVSFIDPETATENVREYIFGSHGWSLTNSPDSPYIYASYGIHLLRYNIENNEIDMAAIWDRAQYKGPVLDPAWSFTADGNYGITYNVNRGDLPYDFYLLDCTNSSVSYLAETEDELNNHSKYLDEIFDQQNPRWAENDWQGLYKLDYTLEYTHIPDLGYQIVATGQDGDQHILEYLAGSLVSPEIPCIGIDGDTIATLLPSPEDGFALGYYRFALINISDGTIIQECPINIGQ